MKLTFTPAAHSPWQPLPSSADIISGFRALGIDPHKKRQSCPQCGDKPTKKNLSVDIDRGIYHCFKCKWSGAVGHDHDASTIRVDPAELQRQIDERERSTTAKHERAARLAKATWSILKPTGTHPYLTRKRVQAHGVRFGADRNGAFLVLQPAP